MNLKHTPEVFIGSDTLNKIVNIIKQLDALNIVIITDKNLNKNTDIIDKIHTALLECKCKSIVTFDGVESNPDKSCIVNGIMQISNLKSVIFVYVGGGSVLDTGKLINFIFNNFADPMKATENIEMFQNQVILDSSLIPHSIFNPEFRFVSKSSPSIAIPTTAGTGSEANQHAVLYSKSKDIMFISNTGFIPTYAILDPKLASVAPFHILISSAFDGFVHSIESLLSSRSNIYTTILSRSSIIMMQDALQSLIKEGYEICLETVEKCLVASHLAGISFASCGLGLLHAIGNSKKN